MTRDELISDVDFLARRQQRVGAFVCDGKRDWGQSSNSLVSLAYGVDALVLPSDWGDYAACVRAVRSLPRHRRTRAVMQALERQRLAVATRYPSACSVASWWTDGVRRTQPRQTRSAK